MNTATLTRSQLAAEGGSARAGFWLRVWKALERHGQRRAAQELRLLAATHAATDPEFAKRLSALAREI